MSTCRYPLAELLGALRELFPRGGGRFVLFEYVMLAGVNDTDADAERLAALADDIEAKFNLITFNPHEGTRFAPSAPEQVPPVCPPLGTLPYPTLALRSKQVPTSGTALVTVSGLSCV